MDREIVPPTPEKPKIQAAGLLEGIAQDELLINPIVITAALIIPERASIVEAQLRMAPLVDAVGAEAGFFSV